MSDNPHTNRWNERYDTEDFVFGTKPNDFLAEVADQLKPGSNVLCLADGEGRNGVHLAGLGHKVTSIDQSSVGLAKADELAASRDVEISTIQADLSDYDLGNDCWDAIVSIFFHIPAELREIIYPGIVKSLRPGGLLILESYTPAQLEFGTGGPPVPELMLTADIARAAFGELTILHLEELERNVVEGIGHTGQAAVVQLIARKD